ncbi:hypothetical protein nbrc107696_25270 [Gordonia spumicola]|uniref:ABC transmembrane type-1 domain-containing protein n=1 Tax=Gordonia spumicola TaxID=589161 RepID=A0A7I9VAE0_9ACTN|nr:sugar ABC transporter permease [Gordonia spumicola]GEE02081.1 hypothetical protein nbrc107696_25270 [Gordonia spumicola]
MTGDDDAHDPNAGGLTPHGDGPDMTPGRHARPADRAPERAVEQTGPIPTIHSDAWVAPGEQAPETESTHTVTPPPRDHAADARARELPPLEVRDSGGSYGYTTPVARQPEPEPEPAVRAPDVVEPPVVDDAAQSRPVDVQKGVWAPAPERHPAPAAAGSSMSMSDILDENPAPAAAVATAAPQAKPSRKSTARRSSERRLALLLAGPAALVMIAVTGYPIVYSMWLSLTSSNLREPGNDRFVGLDNYRTVLSSDYWWTSLWVTLYITVVSVIIELVLGMAIALVMHRALFGRGLVRTVVLIPYGIVTVAAAISWKYAWTPQTGYLVDLLPDGSTPLTQQWSALSVIILAEVWKTTPFMALLLLAGLALVPDDLLKAAQMDGAGAWTRLRKIILPMMKPAILVALLFRTLDAFRVFDNIYVLTSGNHDTGSVSMLGYNNLFKAFNLGIGSAISVLIFLCVALIAVVFIKGFGAAAPGSDDEGR